MQQPSRNDLSSYWMPFTPNKAFKAAPRMIQSAKGQFFTMRDGRKVRDGFSGMWCCNLGHAHPRIVEAIIRQASELDYAPAFNFGHEAAFQLAAKVASLFPPGLEHVFFTNSGSEAVDTALKLSLAYHRARGEAGRQRFIGRNNGYHGVGFGGISVGGMPNNRKSFGLALPGVDHLSFPYDAEADAFTRGIPRSDVTRYIRELDALISLHDASTIAAVIVEPVIGSAGVFIPPAGYLKALREVTRRHGILLILDEVITGFGRLGAANGASFFEVKPDLCTIAKGINNGAVPMGGVVISNEIHDTVMGATAHGIEFFHGYTYSGHPLAVAAGLAAQDILADSGVYENVRTVAPFFEELVHSLKGAPFVTDIRNIGLAAGLTLEMRPGAPGARGYDAFLSCFERGVAIRSNGDTLALAPILTSSQSDLTEIVDTLKDALHNLQ